MNIQVLYKVGALGPGSSLWIIPSLNQSPWSQRINWHLNFQLSKMKSIKFKKPSPPLIKTLKENEMPLFKRQSSSASPLLISSSSFLPNSKVVELPKTKTHAFWMELSYKVWKKLDEPSLRLFLTKDFPVSEFQALWPETDQESLKTSSITLVPHVNLDFI